VGMWTNTVTHLKEREMPINKGELVLDESSGRVGVVMDVLDGRVYLRPPGGGTEWEADPRNVRAAGPEEELRARVAEANAASVRRWGR
jgi:hypothetical protein